VTARVLLVEDDAALAQALALELRHHGYEVREETDGPAAVLANEQWAPELVLLDLGLPSLDGMDVCRLLRDASTAPIIVITAREGIDDRVRALDAGADDYVAKPFSLEELRARIRAALRRSRPDRERRLEFGELELDADTRTASWSEEPIELTQREFDLLEFLMRNPRIVLSRSTLLSEVWGYEFVGGSNTVDVYVGYLRRKLRDAGAPAIIETVWGVGYALRPH
jgi:two-component system response regulator MprA